MTTALKDKYRNAKRCAQERNIEWHFTYDTWIEWWGDDIVNRGTKKGQLVMARYGDKGPYHPDNVRKATKHENNTEAHLGKIKHGAGINFKRAKQIQTPIGKFPSRTAAAMEYKVSTTTMQIWLKVKPNDFYYVKEVI